MATSATIKIKANSRAVYLDKSHDGYPSGFAYLVHNALKHTYSLTGLNSKIPLENAMIMSEPRLRILSEEASTDFGALYSYTVGPGNTLTAAYVRYVDEEYVENDFYNGSLISFVNEAIETLNNEHGTDIEPIKEVVVEGVCNEVFIVNKELAEGLLDFYTAQAEKFESTNANFESNPTYQHSKKVISGMEDALLEYGSAPVLGR